MNLVYIFAVYTPVFLAFCLGVIALSSESKIIQPLAIFVPTCVAGLLAMAVMDTSPDEMDTLTDIMKEQVFWLAILVLAFMVFQFVVRPVCKADSERNDPQPSAS